MIHITTTSINNRSDWFLARCKTRGHYYFALMDTRHGAFVKVFNQIFP